jgi:serine phosphatase RsbU (regulator of sigma subunit)
MIELGEIHVRDTRSVVETRNKILGLAQTLKLDRIAATRIAASTSQAIRTLLKAGLNPVLKVAIEKRGTATCVRLEFANTARPRALSILEPFFDELDISTEGGKSVARKYLAIDVKALDERTVRQERARISRRSRAELMDELRLKNQELQNYNARLEDTVAQRTSELSEANIRMGEDLAAGAKYVESLIPARISGQIATDWRYIPSANLGGDSFGYHWIDDDNFALYLLDVTGHGIDSALLAVTAMHGIRAGSLANTDMRHPGQVLHALNLAFPSERHDGKLFTIWYGVYCRSRRQLSWAGGGHPPALLVHNDDPQRSEILDSTGPIVGALPEAGFDYRQTHLHGSARLYIYSDGVHEVKLRSGKRWTFGELIDFLTITSTQPGSTLDALVEHVRGLSGIDHFEDDFSIVEAVFSSD